MKINRFSPPVFVLLTLTIFATTLMHAQDIDAGSAGACNGGTPCVATYHNDNARDGVVSNETALSPSLFTTPQSNSNFGLLGATPATGTGSLDGLLYAQPLYLSGISMSASSGCSGTQNIVLVATENNSVYAFAWTYTLTSTGNTFSFTQCWKLNLNQTGEFAIPFTALPNSCNNVVPESGITSTPVIDTSVTPPIMYVVTGDQKSGTSGFTYRLHAIFTNSGTEVTTSGYDLSSVFPSGLSPTQQNQRPGLAMFKPSQGKANLFVAFGSFCDFTPYSGYLAGLTFTYSSKTFSTIATSNWVFDTESGHTNQDGGIWMSGAAPAVDGAGNIYLAVGNGSWNGSSTARPTFFGESAVKIAASSTTGLTPVDYYTPNDGGALDNGSATLCSEYGPTSCPTGKSLTLPGGAGAGDFDLGSGGITLISPVGVTSPVCGSNPELVAGGKEGVIYGLCYKTQTGTTLQTLMGGLDGCGYGCDTSHASNQTNTACSQSSTPGSGNIAQCFQGVNAGEPNTIVASPGIRGTEAFWAGPSSSPQNYLYVGGSGTAMIAYQASSTNGSFGIIGDPETTPKTYPYPGTVPAVSWDGSTSTSALLWAIDSGGYGLWDPTSGSGAAKPAVLVVYGAIPALKSGQIILNELWESAISNLNTGPAAVKFTVPTIAGGLVFVPGGAPGYAPGPAGGTGVNCTADALKNTSTPTVCGGSLAVYGKLHS